MERPQPADRVPVFPPSPTPRRQLSSERASDVMPEALGSSLHFVLTEAMSKMGTVSLSTGFVSQTLMDMKASCPESCGSHYRGTGTARSPGPGTALLLNK